MKRYDVTARVGRGGVVYPKSIEVDTGKYVEYKDVEHMIKFYNSIRDQVRLEGFDV